MWNVLPGRTGMIFHDNVGQGVLFGVVCLTGFIGMAGLFVGNAARTASKISLVPEKDPRLGESLAFENF